MQTLSDYASELVPVELPCGDCDATGRQEVMATNVRSFFAPYEYVAQTCAGCQGKGLREVDVCRLCAREEGECARLCRRTACCDKHPVDCECSGGLALYLETFGLNETDRLATQSSVAGRSSEVAACSL